MFIGKQEIVESKIIDGLVSYTLKDGQRNSLSEKLYNSVITSEATEIESQDIITDKVVRVIFGQMSDDGLNMFLAQKVIIGLRNLIDNIWQEGVSRKFEVKTSDDIKLKDLLFS